MKRHIEILGIIYILTSVLGLVYALILTLGMATSGWVCEDTGLLRDTTSIDLGPYSCAIVSLVGLAGGVGVLKRKPWSKVVLTILGTLHILSVCLPPGFPLGTMLGIYTLFIMLNKRSQILLSSK